MLQSLRISKRCASRPLIRWLRVFPNHPVRCRGHPSLKRRGMGRANPDSASSLPLDRFLTFFPVDDSVAGPQVLHILKYVLFRDVLEGAIRQPHVGNRRVLIPSQQQPIVAFLALHVTHLDIADDRRVSPLIAFFVCEIDRDHSVGHLTDFNVTHIYVFDNTAAHGVGLNPQGAVEMRAVHLASFGKDVSRASGYLTADDDAAVAVLHGAFSNDDVLDGYSNPPSIVVPARFERDAIVARDRKS